MLEYAEKIKRRGASEELQQELEQLRKTLWDRDAEIRELQDATAPDAEKDAQISDLHDEIGDLQQDIRSKEAEVDQQQEEIDRLKERASSASSPLELNALRRQLEEKDGDIRGFEDALTQTNRETDRKISAKDRELETKDDELRELEEELSKAYHQSSIDAKETELRSRQDEIDSLKQKLEHSAQKAKDDMDALRAQLNSAQSDTAADARQKGRAMEEKDLEIHTLQQKLQSAEGRDAEAEKLHNRIEDLLADVKDKERSVDEKQDQIDSLQDKLREVESESDEELMATQDRVHELEMEQQRNLKELQALRDAGSHADSQALNEAKARVRALEDQSAGAGDVEKQLQKEVHTLQDQIRHLEQELDDKDSDNLAERQNWDRQRSTLEAAKANIEEQARSLERTIEDLQRAEGSLSSKEFALQQALQSEKQRHDSSRAALQKELDEANDECRQLQRSLDEAQASQRKLLKELDDVNKQSRQHLEVSQQAETSQAELEQVQSQLRDKQAETEELQDKIQGLEDEVEVLQSSLDEDADRAKDEVFAAKSEADGLRRQLNGVQQDLAKAQTDYTGVRNELETLHKTSRANPSPRSSPAGQTSLRNQVRDLEDQVDQMTKDRAQLQSRLDEAERDQQAARTDYDTLQLDLESTSGTHSQLQQKLQESQVQLARARKGKRSFEAEHAENKADLEALQAAAEDAESARNTAQETARDLRKQLKDVQREADRKLQTQINAYETDITNLEQDLEAAQSKTRELTAKNESLASSVSRLKTRLATAETDLATARASRSSPGRDTSVAERKDLHDMLRDAKLKAEDLELKLQERDQRVEAANKHDNELRSQLHRVREERKEANRRADAAADELATLQDRHDGLVEERDELRRLQKGVRFPKTVPGAASSSQSLITQQDPKEVSTALTKATHRHTLELRGLVRQIEYLSARLRREEAFRNDLSYSKRYTAKVLEVYAKVHKLDLGLVRDMGVPVDDVCSQHKRECGVGRVRRAGALALDARVADAGAVMPGVDATPRGKNGGTPRRVSAVKQRKETRPTLRCVAFMVLAGVRMQRGAEAWRGVRKSHEGLVKKLAAVKRDRERKGGLAVAR